MSKDTITVELPIEARGTDVDVAGAERTRTHWRAIAANPDVTAFPLARALAPAVVAWMDRDEWEPLDLPEAGRIIKATLRDGAVETFKVRLIGGGSNWASVWKVDSNGSGLRFIQRVRDVDDLDHDDIIAWEYVEDEPKFQVGDWVRIQSDQEVGQIAEDTQPYIGYTVMLPNAHLRYVPGKFLTPAGPKDVEWKVGDVVPAGTFIGREWVGESFVTGRRSLFGVSDSRTATTDRKITWLGESND